MKYLTVKEQLELIKKEIQDIPEPELDYSLLQVV